MNSLIDETLADFGRSIGMEGLALREGERLTLDLQRVGVLNVELVGERKEDVAVSLVRRIEPPDETACLRLLEFGHYRTPAPFPVRTGLTRAGQLILSVKMDSYQFTLPSMHQAIDTLAAMHDQASTYVRSA